ncbi:MAG: hypothetical protein J0L92_19830 [Deltaproteobacteria bacterium]|nr:hypothetical protein [Deltaproteobacteria bacterium]
MRLQLTLPVLLAAIAGCADPERLAQPPEVDRARFEAEVFPILLRDCGFPACHGDTDRFFRVHGPGRTRLDPATLPYDAATDDEIDATFDRARSMLAAVPDPLQSLLLRKPLEASAGGSSHVGLDALGRNVYASREDVSWQTIALWAGASVQRADAGAHEDDAGSDDASARDAGDASARDASARDAPIEAGGDAE